MIFELVLRENSHNTELPSDFFQSIEPISVMFKGRSFANGPRTTLMEGELGELILAVPTVVAIGNARLVGRNLWEIPDKEM